MEGLAAGASITSFLAGGLCCNCCCLGEADDLLGSVGGEDADNDFASRDTQNLENILLFYTNKLYLPQNKYVGGPAEIFPLNQIRRVVPFEIERDMIRLCFKKANNNDIR